jgi:hypothetical protein
MIQSNDGGANVSFDGGRTWSSQMNQPTAEIYGVWVDNQFPYKLYGRPAGQHDRDHVQPARCLRDAKTGARVLAARPGPIMPHPKDPNIVYGSCKGQYGVMNLKGGTGEKLLGRSSVPVRQSRY